MIRFCTLYSSSSGNCVFASDSGTNILVDAGVSAAKIVTRLNELGVSPYDIHGILVTHEHGDHVCGLDVFARKYSIPVYANSNTLRAIASGAHSIDEKQMNSIVTGETFCIGTAVIRSFKTPHDSAESVGYTVTFDERKLGVATDVGCITKPMLSALAGCEAVVIESNHDVDLLMKGSYPYSLKKRILSDNGHLSNEKCAWLATQLALWGTKHIALGHLSANNNEPQIAYEICANMLDENGFTVGNDVFLSVASKDKITYIL